LIGADKCGIVDPDRFEEMLWPLTWLNRLENHGFPVASNRHSAVRKAEFVWQGNCLALVGFYDFHGFHGNFSAVNAQQTLVILQLASVESKMRH
jgi:hypothetical protein